MLLPVDGERVGGDERGEGPFDGGEWSASHGVRPPLSWVGVVMSLGSGWALSPVRRLRPAHVQCLCGVVRPGWRTIRRRPSRSLRRCRFRLRVAVGSVPAGH